MLASAYDEMQASLRQHRQAAARQVSVARQTRLLQADEPDHPEVADLPLINLIPVAEAKRPEDGDTNWRDGDGRARPVHSGDVTRLRGMCEQLKNIDNAHGGGAALPMTMSYLRHETPLLNGLRQTDPTDRALIDVFALFWLDVGWMAYDASEQQLATENFTRALRLAHAAGDRLLGARVLAAMSHQAIYLGQVRQAIDYAQAARTSTRIVATPHAAAHLRMGEIDAAAAAGEHIVREAWTLHSSHVFGEVAQLASQLARYKSPVAAGFLDQASELLEARGPKAAPAST